MLQKLLKKVETLNEDEIKKAYTMLLILTDDEARYTEGLVKRPEPKTEEPPKPEVPLREKNETVRMLGHQFPPNENRIRGELNDIMEAYELDAWFAKDVLNFFSVSIDLFNLGFIEGKRSLRQKKKATAKPTK